tara:strand:+ start:991 stop:1245 length:255 start_codon:yes stop_codon:yes gene_type:complete
MKNQFRVINRTTRAEQVFNSEELKTFFYCEYDHQTGKIKYKNQWTDYAVSSIKPKSETFLAALGFGFLGLAVVILVTEIVMKWS